MVLHHTDQGGTGVPVVLLPAFPLDLSLWDDVVARLPSTVRAITVDLPGLGENPVPSTGPDLGVAVTGLEGVLDECGVVSAVVVGISTGGYVAAAMARDVPARVRALGLFSTTTVIGPPDEPDQRRATADELERSGTVDAVLSSVDEGLGQTAQRDRPKLRARVRTMIQRQQPRGVAWLARAVAGRGDTSQAVRELDAPVLLLFGEEDTATPPARAAELAALRPDAELVLLAATGHLTPLERPDEVVAAITRFVERV